MTQLAKSTVNTPLMFLDVKVDLFAERTYIGDFAVAELEVPPSVMWLHTK